MDPFYTRFFRPEEWDAIEGYHDELRARLSERGRVLDLGCGDNSRLARYHTRQRRVWGADFRRHPRLQHPERFRLLGGDGHLPFPSSSFDVVASSWVLEHVAEPWPFLGEVARVLKPGGRFVALTVHGWHYVTWLTRLFDLLPHTVTQELIWRLYRRPPEDTFPTHYRLNTEARLEQAAREAGLELETLTRFANPGYFLFCRPLLRAAVLADWCLDRVRPGLGRLYLVATLRKPAKLLPPAHAAPQLSALRLQTRACPLPLR